VYQRFLALTRPHYAEIARLSVRDTELMLCVMLVNAAMCWYIGQPFVALFFLVTVSINETLLRLMFARAGPFQNWCRGHILAMATGLHGLNAFLFALPALYLAADPSFAMKISGLILVLGVQTYIANSWSGIPVFIYVLILPSIVMIVFTFARLFASDAFASSMTDWSIATLALALFIYASLDTLRQKIQAQSAQVTTQRVAATRLTELEEAHRKDPLTGVLNRTAFDSALDVMLTDRAHSGGQIAVFLLDLDSFKPINDTYSHDAGDQVLVETAHRLRDAVGPMGIVGRLGGDEFVCALHELDSGETAIQFAEKLLETISGTIDWDERKLKIGASIGVAQTGEGPSAPAPTVKALCSAADQAMFTAKSAPNGKPVLYKSHLFAPRMTPEHKQALVDGLQSRAVRPYYQPKIHLPTGQIIGLEALARWEHPDKTVRQPGSFLDQITELGLQGDFMQSMAHQVIEDINAMLETGLNPGQVSINVSEVALATHTGRQDLKRIVAKNPGAARHLTFEITEDVFIARAADTIQASISSFRALGVRISLDDFGTGFASFHHLRQLDFDELKIDTSFVEGLGHDATSEVLVRGFLNIASGLGVSVIAEGVETEEQSRDLINMGCVSAQGYLFSPAVPLQAAMQLLKTQQAA